MPDAPKVSGNDAMPVDDIETAYRLYSRRNFTGMEDTAISACIRKTSINGARLRQRSVG